MPRFEPMVSVILPTYNRESYLAESIESVLAQTYTNFELLIVNDCSTDHTAELLDEFRKKDQRIRVIENEVNKGAPASRNIAVELAGGKYLAMMDSDDISLPKRFEKQVAFLERHPQTYVLGSSADVIDPHGKAIDEWRLPRRDRLIRWHSIFRNSRVFCNPSVTMRASIFNYVPKFNENNRASDDSELWATIFPHKELGFANLSEKLIKYRSHPISITGQINNSPTNFSQDARKRALEAYLCKPVNKNVIPAYESNFEVEKALIPDILERWFETYEKFKVNFKPGIVDRMAILREIYSRCSAYVDLEPSETKYGIRLLANRIAKKDLLGIEAAIRYSKLRGGK